MSPDLLSAHADRLAWLNDSWSSIDLTAIHTLRNSTSSTDGPLDFDAIRSHYIETSAGWRTLAEEMLNQSEPVSRQLHYFDGKRGVDVSMRLKPTLHHQMVVHKHFSRENLFPQTVRPEPLFVYWIRLVPIHKAIKTATYLGEAHIHGTKCDMILFRGAGASARQDHVYYLDARSSLPVKVVFFLDASKRELNIPLVVWRSQEVKTVQGYPVVWMSSQEDFRGQEKDETPWMKREFRVESAAFNKTFRKSTFQFDPKSLSDATVADTTEPTRLDGTSLTGDMTASQYVRVQPEEPWSDHLGTGAGILGLTLLASAWLLWHRRATAG